MSHGWQQLHYNYTIYSRLAAACVFDLEIVRGDRRNITTEATGLHHVGQRITAHDNAFSVGGGGVIKPVSPPKACSARRGSGSGLDGQRRPTVVIVRSWDAGLAGGGVEGGAAWRRGAEDHGGCRYVLADCGVHHSGRKRSLAHHHACNNETRLVQRVLTATTLLERSFQEVK